MGYTGFVWFGLVWIIFGGSNEMFRMQPTLCYRKEFEENTISNDCDKEGWLESLSKSYRSDDHRGTFLRKLHDRLLRRPCPHPMSTSHSQGNLENSPFMVKHQPIRALLMSPKDLANPYPRPHRKLAETSGAGGSLLIIVVLATVVTTLGIFAMFLFCCVGRDAFKPANGHEASKNGHEASANGQEDNKPLVNLRPKGKKGKLGHSFVLFNVIIVHLDFGLLVASSSLRKSLRGLSIRASNANKSPSKAAPLPLQSKKESPPPPTPTPPPTPPPTSPRATSSPPAPAAPPPPPPPIPSAPKLPPPPPPKPGLPPPPNPSNMKKPPAPGNQKDTTVKEENKQAGESDGTQTKLKPLFWDKVNAVQNRSMVWHHLKDGSFKVDEEMMVGLFGYVAAQNKKERGKIDSNLQAQPKLIQILDAKKAQNLAILLKALNVTTEEVCDAVKKGTQLPVELISTLLKMAPSQEEELRLRLYCGDVNQLGPSERFLKNLVEIPFAFKRLEVLLFMSSLHEDYNMAKESFATLEVACNKLRSSRLFLRLLEAVLKTGNRMNDGTYRGGAQAFKLDTLLKLSDVKGTDGKTTLLSFVVREIIRYEGIKVARNRNPSTDKTEDPNEETPESLESLGLEVVSKLSEELNDVKKAALVDGENLTATVSKLGNMLKKTKEFMNEDMKTAEAATEFKDAITRFLEYAEADITWMIEEDKRIMSLVKSTGDYFHGKSGKDEGLRLFAIVRDFLKLLDNTCNEVRKKLAIQMRHNQKEAEQSSARNGSEEKGRKRAWQNTRYKILIMRDAMRVILESIYNDDADHETSRMSSLSKEIRHRSLTNGKDGETRYDPEEEGRAPTPPPLPPPPEEGRKRFLLPNIRDKLALLTLNNQRTDDSDGDSDEWSSDGEENEAQRSRTPSDRDEAGEGVWPNKQADDPDSYLNGWNSEDGEMKRDETETSQTRLSLSSEANDDDQLLPATMEDDSNGGGWNSEDDLRRNDA
ncbi:formin-like protein 3 [Cynara cardunculus var. scolymus]|uniref:formin-like protein 3 n=1 Tax=Cynara cardunculus var. scolymus TaxID=59895 RepID=UPI000D623149|nr:formin-like protein 3 [Cynara cardunculus var. scolymus]